MKFKKLTIVMMLTVLGLVSPTRDISMDVVNKLKGLDSHSWNELRKSLCYVSHKNKPVVHGIKDFGDHPIYPDGFRWAEIKLDSSIGQKSLRISNRLISNGQNAGNEMHHCMGQDNTEYLKEFHNIGYPVVYFGYFSQRKVILNTSHKQQKEEQEYRDILERYQRAYSELKLAKEDHEKPFDDWGFKNIRDAKHQILADKERKYEEALAKFKAIQAELKEKEPDVLLNRYQVKNKETPQLRLYFKDYEENKAEYYNGRTLALYIDNPTTEDLGLAMSVCKVAHACFELDKDIYKKLKKNNNAQEDKFFKSSLEAQTKGAYHISEEEFLIHKRLSRVFMQDFLTYGGKTDMIDAGIGAFIGFFSSKANSAIRNQFDDMYKEQKPKMLDSNRLMLATIVGFGAKEQLTNSAIRCNILAYQDGFYKYLLERIQDVLTPKPSNEDRYSYGNFNNRKAIYEQRQAEKRKNKKIALKLVEYIDSEFLSANGIRHRQNSISSRIEDIPNQESEKCNSEFNKSRANYPQSKHQGNYQQHSFLEKRVKLRRHRLAKKFNIGTVIEVFQAIKEFFIKVTGVVVATATLVVHIVSTVIFGVIYVVSIVAEAIGGLLKVTSDFMIGETHISNIFLLPSQAVDTILGPIGKMAYQIKNATSDQAFNHLLINQLRKLWVQNELFYAEPNVNDPVNLSTYMMFSKKPEIVNNIFRILLSK